MFFFQSSHPGNDSKLIACCILTLVCVSIGVSLCVCHGFVFKPAVNVEFPCHIHRASNMSAHVLLNLSNELEKVIKFEACRAFYCFF